MNSDAGTLQGWGSLATPEPAPELTPGQQAHAAAAEAFERAAAAATPESYHPKGETEEADEAEEDPKIDIEALQAGIQRVGRRVGQFVGAGRSTPTFSRGLVGAEPTVGTKGWSFVFAQKTHKLCSISISSQALLRDNAAFFEATRFR